MQLTVTAHTLYRHSAYIVHRQKWGKVILNQRVADIAERRLIFFNLFLILVRGVALWITRRCPVVLTTSVGQLCAPWRSHPDHLSPIPVLGLDGVVWRYRNPPRTEQALVSVEAAHFSRHRQSRLHQTQLLSQTCTKRVPACSFHVLGVPRPRPDDELAMPPYRPDSVPSVSRSAERWWASERALSARAG